MPQQSSFVINGIIDTSKNVLSNIDALCQASGCWISYDVSVGQWAVIINNTGSSVFSFDNSNIIDNITISGTGIDQLYNSVTVQYPLQDLAGDIDYANLTLDPSLRFPNENDNNLSLQTNLVNNPVQAQFMGQIALKQNRVDKVITITTDFSAIGLKAGDIIDVTEDMYGYTNKLFRVITIDENDGNDGSITLTITALEYDATVYDASGLTYTNATSASGIVPYNSNSAIQAQNAAAARSLLTINSFQTGIINATHPGNSFYEISLGHSVTLPYTGQYHTNYSVNWGGTGHPTINIGGTNYPWGVQKNSTIVLKTNGTIINNTSLATTGDVNVQLYEDHFLDSFWTGTQGQVVDFYFQYQTDWGGDYGGNGGTGTNALFLITSETKFNGTS